jgi:peptide/nickel transport system permease protein
MLTYILRKMMYMPFVLMGVIFITFVLFQMSTTPEALARIKLGEKASERVIYEWLVSEGHASWTEAGREKQQQVTDDKLDRQGTAFFVDGRLRQLEQRHDRAYRAFDRTAARLQRALARDAESERASDLRGDLSVRRRELGSVRIQVGEALAGARGIEAARRTGSAETGPLITTLERHRLAMEWALEDIFRYEQLGLDTAELEQAYNEALDAFNQAEEGNRAVWQEHLAHRDAIEEIGDITPDLSYTSWYVSFGYYLRDILTLNFGETNNNRPVMQVIREGIGPSLMLMLPAFLIAELIGVFFGLMAAIYRQTRIDHVIVISAILMMSINSIALVMFGQKFIAADLHYAPISGFETGFGAARFLVLPLFLYVLLAFGERVRFARIVMLDETNQDYVRTARAKGLGENRVLFKHVLRNTLIPLITRWVVAIPTLYLGSLVLETFFGIPGLGRLTIDAVNNSDANVIRAVVVIGSVGFMLANLLSDVLYAVADPRVRLE